VTVLLFTGGARLRVDEPPEEIVQKVRAGLVGEAEGWRLLHDSGFDLWINVIEVAAVLHDDDPRAQIRIPVR
jgi:hypothetical protein